MAIKMKRTFQIDIVARALLPGPILQEMHSLRAKVFRDTLRWEVPTFSGMEIDAYDALNPFYMIIRDRDKGLLCGCWRLLPTEGPYMLKDSFPQLLHGKQAPCGKDIWELSRFTVQATGSGRFGFSDVAMGSFFALMQFGRERGINHYITVTTIAVERLLRYHGVVTERFGPPVSIGAQKVVALMVDAEISFASLSPKPSIERLSANTATFVVTEAFDKLERKIG